MADIMVIFPGLGFRDLDPMTIPELMQWHARADARSGREKKG